MYSTQDIASRIKQQMKTQGKGMKSMLSELGLGINTISEFSKGKQLSCLSLARIADHLNCSVDYLLGRDSTTINNTVTGSNGVIIGQTNEHITINNGHIQELTKQESDLLRVYNTVDSKKQIEIMNYIYKMEGEIK